MGQCYVTTHDKYTRIILTAEKLIQPLLKKC